VLVRVQFDDPAPPVTLVGLHITMSPVVGLTVVERLTVPVNPFLLVMVIFAVPVFPAAVKVRLALLIVNVGPAPLMKKIEPIRVGEA
jgi:hypothetical protein